MIDIHCHLLPYVDDGANDLDEARLLLSSEAEQGVTEICLTPHLREGMFETPDEKIRFQFERISGIAGELGLTLRLSREYHVDGLFWEKLEAGEIIPVGRGVILTEFSSADDADTMARAVMRIKESGFVPLVAHVERYPAADADTVKTLRSLGAATQVHADAVLGYDGRYVKKTVWEFIGERLVDVVASDAHGVDDRPVRMRECMTFIKKKAGDETAERLMLKNPGKIIKG